jgi:hypothetical protein
MSGQTYLDALDTEAIARASGRAFQPGLLVPVAE